MPLSSSISTSGRIHATFFPVNRKPINFLRIFLSGEEKHKLKYSSLSTRSKDIFTLVLFSVILGNITYLSLFCPANNFFARGKFFPQRKVQTKKGTDLNDARRKGVPRIQSCDSWWRWLWKKLPHQSICDERFYWELRPHNRFRIFQIIFGEFFVEDSYTKRITVDNEDGVIDILGKQHYSSMK